MILRWLWTDDDKGWIDLRAHGRLAYWSAWTERQREGSCEPATVDRAAMKAQLFREREARLSAMNALEKSHNLYTFRGKIGGAR